MRPLLGRPDQIMQVKVYTLWRPGFDSDKDMQLWLRLLIKPEQQKTKSKIKMIIIFEIFNMQENCSSYTKRDYERIQQWYVATKANQYPIQNELIAKFQTRSYCRLIITHLTYSIQGYLPVNDSKYTVEILANFYSKEQHKFIARPFECSRETITKKTKLIFAQPLVLYFHMFKYNELVLFVEYQLINDDNERIRLGYIQLDPYQENTTENATFLFKGTPLKKKEDILKIGSCFYTLQMHSKTLELLRLLIPQLMIVDSKNQIPCANQSRLPNKIKQPILLEPHTSFQIDMIRFENNFSGFLSQVQRQHSQKNKFLNISTGIQEFQLLIGSHNTWNVIGNDWTLVKLRIDQQRNIRGPASRVRIDPVYDIAAFAIVIILNCKVKIEFRSENVKKEESKMYPLCWYALPLALWKQSYQIQIPSMNEPIFNKKYQLKNIIKLSCRIFHENYSKYKPVKQVLDPTITMSKIFQKSQQTKNQWKIILKEHKDPTSLEQIAAQQKLLLHQKNRIQKILSKRLYKPKLIPTGTNKHIPIQQPSLKQIKIQDLMNKCISLHIRIDSFLAYFNEKKFRQYFVPRMFRFDVFLYDKKYESSIVSLNEGITYGIPSLFLKSAFMTGNSVQADQHMKFQFQIEDKAKLNMLLDSNLIIIVFDAQSYIVYGTVRIRFKNIISIQTQSPFLRIPLQIIHNEAIRGSITIECQFHLRTVNPKHTVSNQHIPVNTISNQLSQTVRINSRINHYKLSKNQVITNVQQTIQNKEIQLQLIKKFKEEKLKKYARKIANTVGIQNSIKCHACYPQFFIWEYTNNQNSINNDYTIIIEDPDRAYVSVEELSIIQSNIEFTQACRILGLPPDNFKQMNYKNEFHLKSEQKIRIIAKFLTYRVPNTSKNIESHIIKLKMLRNTLPCDKTQLLIQPQPAIINDCFTYYQVMDSIVEIQLPEQFATRHLNHYVLPIQHSSTTKWEKNRLIVSMHMDSLGIKEFMVVVYKTKMRMEVLEIIKVIVYVYEGIKKQIKLGQTIFHSLRLIAPKTRIVRLESSQPSATIFQSNIVTVTSQQQKFQLQIFAQHKSIEKIVLTAVDVDTNQLLYGNIVQLQITEHVNTKKLLYESSPYTSIRDKILCENSMVEETQFTIRVNNSMIIFPINRFIIEGYSEMEVPFSIAAGSGEFVANIFVYNSYNLLIKAFEVAVS